MISLFGKPRGSRGQQPGGSNFTTGGPEREEDGFVLLGETAVERTTVQYGQEQPGGVAPPPAYHQVAQPRELPAPVNSPPVTSMNSPTQVHSVLSDIPFTFSRHLAASVGSNSSLLHVPPLRRPDLTQYSYDFHVERSVLREAGLLEEWEWRRKNSTRTESMEVETSTNNQTEEPGDLMTFD